MQVLAPFWISTISPKGDVVNYHLVDPKIVLNELVIQEGYLRDQVQLISAQIMFWGGLAARAKRVWEKVERDYRIWRDKTKLDLLSPAGKPADWKKPAVNSIDFEVRALPEYAIRYEMQENAEEVYNATTAILEGFKAKKDVMKQVVYRHQDGGQPRLSV